MADLADTITQISVEALAFLEAAQALPETIDRALGTGEGLFEFVTWGDERPAPGAIVLGFRAQASDRALSLLAAFRAGNAQLRVIEQALSHISSPVGCDDTTVEGVAGRESPPPAPGGNSPPRSDPALSIA